MNWLIIQSDGEHAANRHLRECYGIADGLARLGHQVHIWGKRHAGFHYIPNFEEFDAIFCAEQYEFEWLPDFTKIKNPIKIQWVVDLHVHTRYVEINGFDIACHATKSLMSKYPCSKNIWFPNAFDQRNYILQDDTKTTDLGFVGSVGSSRREYIDKLSQAFPGFYCSQIIGNEMLRRIQSLRIHWNRNMSCDLNYRTFETIGMGTCLITNRDPCLADLGFVEGKNVLTYSDYDECRVKIQDSLQSGSWESIGKAARDLSFQHTYEKRMAELIKGL